MLGLALILALVFSPAAALSSYFITYAEYKKHWPENPARARKLALNFAFATFIFFALMIFAAVAIIDKFLP